jgi:hypothetical protein
MRHEPREEQAPRLHGSEDLIWVAVIFGCSAVLVTTLLRHLELECDTYRLAHTHAEKALSVRNLEEAQRRLDLEEPVRMSEIDLRREASERLGMGPAKPTQVTRVGRP